MSAMNADSGSKSHERRPLLSGDTESSQGQDRQSTKFSIWNFFPQIEVTEPRFRFLPLIGCLIILVNEGEYYFKQIGYFRGIESLYCIQHYDGVDPDVARLGRHIPESMCKIDAVQKKVATANGIMMFVRMASSFLGTMPLGYMADRLGRRYAQIMHKIGTLMYTTCVVVMYLGYPTVPIWVGFLGGLGGLIGANFDLNIAVMLAAYTDAMPSSSQRATWFFITTSMQYVGQVAFPLAAGRAINLDGKGGTSHVSLFISLGMAVAGLLMSIFLFPETMKKESMTVTNDQTEDESTTKQKQKRLPSLLASRVKSMWASFQHSVRGIGTLNLSLLVISIFLATTAIKAVDWLGIIQYPVIKFGFKYDQSAYVLAIQAVFYIFTYFALLPGYNRLGAFLGFTPSSTSLLIMLASVIFLEAGSVFLGLSATAPQFIIGTCIYTLGAGMPIVMQAYIANLVDKSGLGRLLAVISLFQVGGKLCASGIGPLIINAGIDSGNESLKGSIFFFAAAVFILSASSLGLVALRTGVTKKAAEDVVEEAAEQD